MSQYIERERKLAESDERYKRPEIPYSIHIARDLEMPDQLSITEATALCMNITQY